MTTILNSLEKFLIAEITDNIGKQSIDPAEDLLEQGIIDSLGILKLVTFLEESQGIKIDDEDIVPENFQSLNSMVRFVEEKMQRSSMT